MAKHQRKSSHIELIEKHYIFCEGKITETNYFNAIKKLINKNAINRNAVNIEILHENANCDVLLQKANAEVEYRGIVSGHIWCIYDKDDFSKDRFDKAEELAKTFSSEELKYHAIWSNQCFELWLLLHFEYYNSSNDRKNYFDKLDSIFKEKTGKIYDKAEENIYGIVNKYGSQTDAIKYAKKLFEGKEHLKPSGIVPATKMYEVIEEISKYL